MVLTAFRGALGFLTRLPIGHDERAWAAFRRTPATFPLAGYVIGAFVAVPLLLPAPAPTVALAFLVGVYVVSGINHADGVADLGDALVVHGDVADRRAVMRDTTVGVGAALSLGLVLVGLGFAGLALATLPLVAAVSIVVAAEVGAKLSMATLTCLGRSAHDGLGSQLADRSGPRGLAVPIALALPACAIAPPAGALAVVFAVGSAVMLLSVANVRLGGVSGDVFGAGNELGRVVALHVGVIVWMHF